MRVSAPTRRKVAAAEPLFGPWCNLTDRVVQVQVAELGHSVCNKIAGPLLGGGVRVLQRPTSLRALAVFSKSPADITAQVRLDKDV